MLSTVNTHFIVMAFHHWLDIMGLCQTEQFKINGPWSIVLSPDRLEGSLALWTLHVSSLISSIKAPSTLHKQVTRVDIHQTFCLIPHCVVGEVEGTETTSRFTNPLFANTERETLPPQLRNLPLTRFVSLTLTSGHSILSGFCAFM